MLSAGIALRNTQIAWFSICCVIVCWWWKIYQGTKTDRAAKQKAYRDRKKAERLANEKSVTI